MIQQRRNNMFTTPVAYLKNPWLRRFWEHGGEGPDPDPWVALNPQLERGLLVGLNPQPEVPSYPPWVQGVVAQFVRAAVAKDLAARLEGGLKSELAKSADGAINKLLDDYCGNVPKIPLPWPWPGPPPWTWEIVSGLSLVAHSLQPGSLRDGILDITSKATQKSMAR
jgi:hypothetical protein